MPAISREDYRKSVKTFLSDPQIFPIEDLHAFCKRLGLIYEKEKYTAENQEDLAEEFLEMIFSENRIYAMLCVLNQFKKYKKEGYEKITSDGQAFAKPPIETLRPQISLSVKSPQIEVPANSHTVSPHRDDTIFPQNLKAIIIGVGKDLFGNSNNSYCENDAMAIKRFLMENWGVEEKNICDLDLIGYVKGSTANARLKKICEDATEEDCLLFYFAGYGMEIGGNSYLMTSDSYIHTKTVRNALRLITINEYIRHCKAKVKIRIFDANYSGQRLEELNKSVAVEKIPQGDVQFYGDILPKKMQKDIFANGSGWITFTACSIAQKSYEVPELEHGIFTYYLLKGLKEQMARRGNRNIYMEDVKIYTCQKVIETMQQENILQYPQYQCEVNGNILMEPFKDEQNGD